MTVSNAFLKSTKIAKESSFLFLAIVKSEVKSKIVSSVECLGLNPFCLGSKYLCSSKKFIICLCTTFSTILPGMGSRATGRRFPASVGFATLGIGTIVAIFHALGYSPDSMDLLTIYQN